MKLALLALAALCAAAFAPAAEKPAPAAPPALSAPVVNFTLPTFTQEGYRSWLLRGTEGRFVSQNQIDLLNMTLSIFSGDASNRIDTIILSPQANVFVNDGIVRGPGTFRLIRDDFEASGRDWTYDHRQKRVSIQHDVRVVFHAALTDILR